MKNRQEQHDSCNRKVRSPLPEVPVACTLLLILALLSPAGAAEPRAWVTRGYEAFARGTFDAGGDNLYVSRNGRVQMIRVWDVNRDGHIDLFFGQSHDHVNYQPVLIHPQRAGGPAAEAVIRLPTLRAAAVCVADLDGNGFDEVLVLNSESIPSPMHASYLYWGGPDGLGPRYRTWLPTFTPLAAFAADFNGDGLKEVVVVNGGRERFDLAGGCISVHWQTAEGLFPLGGRDDHPVHTIRAADMADVDGDGLDDLVLLGRLDAGQRDDSLYLQRGAPTGLGPPEPLQVADGRVGKPRLLAIDGRTHLAVLTADAIDVYTLAEARPAPVCRVGAPGTYSLAVADLDDDGHDDLISARPGAVDWRRGTGTGFDDPPRQSLAIDVADVAAADVTGDGRPDLAVAVYRAGETYTAQSRVYPNTGGVLDVAHPLGFTTHGAAQVRIADLDGDDRPDLLFTCGIGGRATCDPPVRVYLGDGDGDYRVGRHLDLPARSAYGGFMADYNDDGFVDLLVTNEHDMAPSYMPAEPGSYLYWGGEDGLSAERRALIPGKHAKIPLTADLDRDGWLDLIVGEGTGPSWYYRGGPEGFSAERRTAIEPSPGCALQLADVDRDGWLDLFASGARENVLYLLPGGPNGFDVGRLIELPAHASHMEVADLDGNGWLDLVLGAGGSPARGFASAHLGSAIWWGTAAGFSAARRTQLLIEPASREVAIADLNRDGHLDLVFSSYNQAVRRIFNAHILWGNKACAYSLDHVTRLRQASSLGLMVADLNHDDWPDIVFCNHSTGGTHLTDSRIHWNRAGRFGDDDVTLLPTIGPHNALIADLGNAYTRRLEEAYTSEPFERPADARFRSLSWEALTPLGTSVVFQVRTAPTRERLQDATWIGPSGAGTHFPASDADLSPLPADHRWLQYRALLRTPNGAATPVLTGVAIAY